METFDCTVGNPAPEGSVLVASYDVAGPYEVDEGQLYQLPDGRYYFRWASGCSCWDGDYSSEVHDDLGHFAVFGASRDQLENLECEAGFEHLKDEALNMRAQSDKW